jgi:hypothetical protein
MPAIENLEQLQIVLEEMASVIHSQATREAGDTEWIVATYDVRGTESGGVCTLTVEFQPGKEAIYLEEDAKLAFKSQYIWDAQHILFGRALYGLKISVTRDGRSQIDYNYDPSCISDPSFYPSVDD